MKGNGPGLRGWLLCPQKIRPNTWPNFPQRCDIYQQRFQCCSSAPSLPGQDLYWVLQFRFAVVAEASATKTGSRVVTGEVGVSPATSITGFAPGVIAGGTTHPNDATAN